MYLYFSQDNHYYITLILSLPIIALFSFFDDIYDLKWTLKILVDAITTLFILFIINNLFLEVNIVNNLIFIILFFFILWFINLINFTDGSDGYLCLVAAFSFILNTLYIFFIYNEFDYFKIFFIIIVLNFFIFNKKPSKIFLGDSGSRPIAIIFVITIAFDFINYDYKIILIWYLSLMVILIDTGYTLLQRLFKKNILSRHQDHAYQLLANKLSHNYSLKWYTINLFMIVIPSIYLFYFSIIDIYYILLISFLIISIQVFYIKFKYKI